MSKPPPQPHFQVLRILLVDEGGVFAAEKEHTHVTAHPGFSIVTHTSLEAALRVLDEERFDAIKVVVTDETTRENAKAILSAVWQLSEDTAVLVVVVDEEVGWDLIRSGAQDFVTPWEAFGQSATRRIRAAVERQKWREKHHQATAERELEIGGQYAHRPTISSGIYELASLKRRGRVVFDECVADLVGLLDRAYAARLGSGDLDVAEELAELAARMGQFQATPKDVVHVHKDALAESLRGVRETRHQSLREEARLLLLGLMAKLASYYRLNSHPEPK